MFGDCTNFDLQSILKFTQTIESIFFQYFITTSVNPTHKHFTPLTDWFQVVMYHVIQLIRSVMEVGEGPIYLSIYLSIFLIEFMEILLLQTFAFTKSLESTNPIVNQGHML